jgi:hypothetical protein
MDELLPVSRWVGGSKNRIERFAQLPQGSVELAAYGFGCTKRFIENFFFVPVLHFAKYSGARRDERGPLLLGHRKIGFDKVY